LPATTRLLRLASFFKALGWDVENEAGLPHHQREVIVERGESETTGRPDYSFLIGAFQYLIDWHFVPVAQVPLSGPAAFRCLFQEGL